MDLDKLCLLSMEGMTVAPPPTMDLCMVTLYIDNGGILIFITDGLANFNMIIYQIFNLPNVL